MLLAYRVNTVEDKSFSRVLTQVGYLPIRYVNITSYLSSKKPTTITSLE
jgi:hypothetical protein